MSKVSILTGGSALVLSSLLAIASQPAFGQEESSRKAHRVDVEPYLEVAQTVSVDLEDGDAVTYTTAAAGVNASYVGSRFEGQANVRYEHRFVYDDNFSDQDIVTGLVRGSYQIVPGTLTIDGGAVATRFHSDLRGSLPVNFLGSSDNSSDVYSAYIGPTLTSHIGDIGIGASYRFGYTRAEGADIFLAPGLPPINQFDESTSHVASASIGQSPGRLPFGWKVSANYLLENTDQLDQRVEDFNVRGDLTVPLSRTFALVGGVGYEDVEVSERDAVRDAAGNPIIDNKGRFVTDSNSPRLLSYEHDGLIWDAGVLWRPSRKTSLEARVGERYGSTTYYGSFSYVPDSRSALVISAYDQLQGFGSGLNRTLAGIDTTFDATRNPLTGDLGNCVTGVGGGCFGTGQQSLLSAARRSRGINALYSRKLNQEMSLSANAGYNRNRYIASPLGPLGQVDGLVEEVYYAGLSFGHQLSVRNGYSLNAYGSYIDSGFPGSGDGYSLGANGAYYHEFIDGLSGSLALGIDYYDTDLADDSVIGSARAGLRYSF